ncbi:AMP-binding protein [Salicibibacter cibi]|uniref:acetate--CoA ligase n=1 Tax=Salicibibacter cibi TaxID=2743001 RepID=A0A7T7CFZ2_9BACI|nr:AMP-binding protein [Salicibibacter cibi]QQK80519.1 AMP-binding protein [Salicibibacter cibi]
MSANPVWFPTEDTMQQSPLYEWIKELGFESYEALYDASIRDISWFWGEAEKRTGIEWFQPYQQVLDLSKGKAWPAWFVGGQLNVAHNCLERWVKDPEIANRPAIIWEREDYKRETYTYAELNDWVNQVANGLKQQGISKGDRIVIQMPMIPEMVVAVLAIIKLGAIFVPSFSGFGADPIAKRLDHSQAKMLITVDGYLRSGNVFPVKEVVDEAVSMVSCVEKVVVVTRMGRDIPWMENRDMEWVELESGIEHFEAEPMDSMDPCMVIYTSGTTGRPKGTVHNHGPYAVKGAFGNGDRQPGGSGGVNFWITDMGWIMGPSHVFGSLLSASTMLLYEGSPTKPSIDRLWELIDRHQVTYLGIAPTLIRSLMQHGEEPVKKHDLSSLMAIGSTGEPWNPEPWQWLYEKVINKRFPIINFSGGTEIGGVILTNISLKPIAPANFNARALGMDAQAYNSSGEPVVNETGELVLRQPWLGMTDGFWQDPERYEETYWQKWENTWVHGDAVIQDEDGYWTIFGRSDDTMNIAGKRLGPAEVESIIVDHPAVLESAVIGVPDDVKGEAPVCFVVLNQGNEATKALMDELIEMISKRLGKALSPKAIHAMSDLPKTKNEKIKHRTIRKAYLKEDPGDLDLLVNPQTIEEIGEIQ